MEFKLCKELIGVDGEGRVSPRVQVVLSLPIKDMECSLTNLVFLSQASCTIFMAICSPTLWRRHCGHCSHQNFLYTSSQGTSSTLGTHSLSRTGKLRGTTPELQNGIYGRIQFKRHEFDVRKEEMYENTGSPSSNLIHLGTSAARTQYIYIYKEHPYDLHMRTDQSRFTLQA